MSGPPPDDGADLRVGIAFPFDQAALDTFAAVSPRLRLRIDGRYDEAGVDAVAADDLDGLISSRLPSDLDRTPSLRWLQVMSAGVENLVGPGRGGWPDRVTLTNARGAYAVPIAQYTMAAILHVAERVDARRAQQALRIWPDDDAPFTGRPVRGATLVIVGYGGIGREIARLAQAHGMRVLAVKADPSTRTDDGFHAPGTGDPQGIIPELFTGIEGLAEVAREADFMSITLPLTERSRGVVSHDVLAALPAHAWIINTGRGPVIDDDALLAALNAGQLAGAVLDVFDEEPLPGSSPFWGRSDVVITPHVSGAEARDELVWLVTENLRRFVAGEPLWNRVIIERGY